MEPNDWQKVFAEIDNDFDLYAEGKIPAHALGIIYQGQLVHTDYKGIIHLEQEIPTDRESHFKIASMTKSITCMGILLLRDQGKLRLDDAGENYVPELKNWKSLTSDAPKITIRDLMSHGAGLPEDNPWGDRHLAWQEKDMLDSLAKGVSFSNNPGEYFEYSNLAYGVLGQVIKNVSGQSYQSFLTENVLQPLGMTHTFWEIDDVPDKQLAKGYRLVEGKYIAEPLLHDGAFGAMGGLISTIEDFAKYIAFHQSVYPDRNDAETGPIKRSSVREMHRPWMIGELETEMPLAKGNSTTAIHGYGYGLFWMNDGRQRTYIGHSGSVPGFNSHWWLLPEYELGIVSFANAKYPKLAPMNLMALDKIINRLQLKKTPRAVSEILQKRTTELMSFLPDWEGAQQSDVFGMNFFLDNIPDLLQKETQQYFHQLGKIRGNSPFLAENDLRGSVKLLGEHADLQIKLTLTPEKEPKIQEVDFRLIGK